MKSGKRIRILTYVAMTMILLLQGIWIANAYQLTQRQLYSEINRILNISLNRELIIREKFIIESMANEVIGISANDYNQGVIGSTELLMQDFFARKKHFISLHRLDTIFHSEIARQNLHGKFIINRINPNTGEVLETTDPKRTGILKGALTSEIIPIRIDKSEGVQVLLVSPYRAIFRQMLFAMILSLLLILFVGYTLFFVMRSFAKERHLRQLQADFSNALIHNMASPLQTIYQVNALMKNDQYVANAEKRNKSIELARQQIVNLQALTDRILTVARAEKSPLSPEIKPTEVTQIILQLIEKFSVQVKKKVSFSTFFQPDYILFDADESMLYNAISNLIDNAIKYSGASVEIGIDCQLKDNGLHIGVKDNGYGISSADQRTIFEKFERGIAVKRKEATGFGLGLSYVKSVAEAHHGTVNLFSKKGEGTLFELFFPLNNGPFNNGESGKNNKQSDHD
jgi:two-component system phosphate regulon sensor histidine kinase PhoR